jgi:CubicO group peptidase (beta-lactamase class C family)
MLEETRNEELEVRSVLIVRNDHLVLESYVHPYTRDIAHDVKSVSKSVISALVGIALRDSILPSLDQPVQTYFSQYAAFSDDSLKNDITLGHLLTMTSGLDIDENGPAMNEISSQEDMIEATFARSMRTTPGEYFQYCTFLTLAMTRVLTDASGRDLLELSNDVLFGPLGFTNVHWGKDPQGYRFGGDQLWLRPIDMAKFGSLFLHHGRWRDTQVVPESWVTASTTNRFAEFDTEGYRGYGYWWWLPGDGTYRARGAFGQIITVYPDENMVVVFTGASNEAFERITSEFLLPAISEDAELPPNEQSVNRLRRLTQQLSHPEPRAPSPLPAIANEISGKPFRLEQNNLEFSDITFWFGQNDVGRVVIGHTDGTLDLSFGMDNVYRLTHNADWGMRTDGNTYGLRARWAGGRTLVLDLHEVGEPFHFDVELTFENDDVQGTFTWQPLGWPFAVSGTRE